MTKSLSPIAILASIAIAIATPAWAHTGTGLLAGADHGLLHPLTGIDHLLAMVAVGLWAAQLGGRALWALPAAFVGAMAAGAATAWQGLELPLVESAIAVSLVLVGGAVWLARRVGLAAAVLVTAAAGFMHGQAHGAELPEAASPLAYALGFLAATAALHAVGVFGGRAMLTAGRRAGLALRGVGALVALGGVALLIA